MITLPELKRFFQNNQLPEGPIRIDKCSVILDPKKLVASHIKFLEGNSGKKRFMPYYQRLVLIQRHIEKKS